MSTRLIGHLRIIAFPDYTPGLSRMACWYVNRKLRHITYNSLDDIWVLMVLFSNEMFNSSTEPVNKNRKYRVNAILDPINAIHGNMF